jgi:hypothetical protein
MKCEMQAEKVSEKYQRNADEVTEYPALGKKC